MVREVRNVPFKRTGKNPLIDLEKAEIDALLGSPNPETEQGQKDHALLSVLASNCLLCIGCRWRNI